MHFIGGVPSKELKINPNTAAKIVAHLVNEGLLETLPGIGTVVAALDSSRKERTQLLGQRSRRLVAGGQRLGASAWTKRSIPHQITGSVPREMRLPVTSLKMEAAENDETRHPHRKAFMQIREDGGR